MAFLWRKHGGALALLACAVVSVGAWAQSGPTIFVGEPVEQRVCRPTITRVGCVFSPGPDPDPIPGHIAHQDEDEWSDYEHGYIVPTFECGAKANTCDVEFEDETVTTDDYGVVDKEDTNDEWRWECHSDNGTVRQCSASKDGG